MKSQPTDSQSGVLTSTPQSQLYGVCMNPPPDTSIPAPVHSTGFTEPVPVLGHRISYSASIAQLTLKKEERKTSIHLLLLSDRDQFFWTGSRRYLRRTPQPGQTYSTEETLELPLPYNNPTGRLRYWRECGGKCGFVTL